MELADSVDELRSSSSIRSIPMPDFEVLDARIASALNKIIHNSHFKRKISLEEQKAQKEDRFLRGRQIAYLIYEQFRVTGTDSSVETYTDLFTIAVRNGDIQEFDSKWDGILLSMTKIPPDDILEGLYKLRIRESDKLKTVLELYDLETHQKKLGPDYHRLKAMVKRSIEQEIRNKNFEARSGNFEKNAVVKNPGIKQRAQRILGDCWQWEANGQCVKGDNCSFRHDINKRGKSSPSNPSQNSFTQQSERKPSRTRSPRGKSPSGRTSRWPCKDYLKGTCNNSSCKRWHPPECLFYKSKNGCRFGEKCSFAHRQVDTQPTKWSKSNNDKSAVALLKKDDWHERESVANGHHDSSGKPDCKRGKKLGRNSSKRQLSDARQLGCVFQDMTPPKSILRKSTDMPKPIQRVKFTKAIARHTKIRDQNPSLGYICPGEPHERSPNAPKFEDRSREETEWQELGAREAAWKLAKSVFKLKEHEKAAFFSSPENRCHLASSLKPEEREFVVDSGASMHMISKKDLSEAEMDTLTKSCSPTIVITANGEVQTQEEAIVYVKELDMFLTMKVLENTPAVLSLGKLCDENGYSYEWINGQKPHLIKDGIRIVCNTENFVPIVVPGLSSSSSGSSSTSRTPLTQESHSSSSSSSSPSSPTVGELSVREREDVTNSDISPVPVSRSVDDSSGKPDADQANQTPKTNKKETTIARGNPLHSDNSEIPEWLQEFRENLVDDEIPLQGDSHASSSHETSLEPIHMRREELGKHNVHTHFPKDRNCEICKRTKITRAPCRRRKGEAVPRADNFGDLITADHKVLSDNCESRNNHRYAVVVQDLATQWIQAYPCKNKTSQETQRSLQKFLEPERKPKVIYTDNSLEFGKACEDLSWNHCTSTPHRSETNGIAERAVRRVKEGTSAVLLQSGLNESWWADSMECYTYLRNVTDLLSDGKTPYERRFGKPFEGPIVPFGSLVEYHPITAKDQSRIHQFGKKVLPGLFLGYALYAGGIWKGDVLIADLEELETMDASEIYSKRLNAKEVIFPQKGEFIFPIADGRIKTPGEDQALRQSTLIRPRPNRGEGHIDFLGESEGSFPQPHDSFPVAGEAMHDFWSMSGSFIYRHHVEPRVELYSPKEESFPIPLKYIDVTRTTHTNLDVKQEKRIDDYWNIDGSRDLSDPWTGFTQFTLLDEKPPDGYTWSGGRLTRKQLTSRPDHLWPELWKSMGKNAKLKEKQKWAEEKIHLDNARKLRGIYFIDPEDKEYKETIKNARKKLETSVAPAMPCKASTKGKHGATRGKSNDIKSKLACILEANESTRMRMGYSQPHNHEDHIAGKGENSLQHYNLVHKFIPMPQAMKIPAAKAAVDKEWEKLEKISAWNLTKVKSKKEVIDEARTKGATVHFASLMDICHLKNAELETKHQKYKGRVVLRGDIVKDNSGSYAVFTEQGSSASQMTAAKIMDIISRLPGCDGQAADAVSAYTQVKMEDAHKLLKVPKSECPDIWIRLPRHKWPKSWSSMEDPVVPLERNLYGHPLAGLLWERQFEKVLLKHGWEKIPNWECLFVHREKGLFLSVYVDDIKLAGKKHNIDPMWKVLNKEVDLGEPTSFLDHVYLGCTQRECEVSQNIVDNYRTMFESRISAGGLEKLPFSQKIRISSWSYDMVGHAKKCVERYCELANKTTQQLYKVSTPCIDDHHFKEEETKSVGELSTTCSQIVLKCLYLARIGRPDILWSVNKLARSITKWTKACDKRLNRLISYIHHTSEYKQYCHVGNTAKQCRLGLFQDSDFAGDLEDSKSTSGGTLCIFGSHTFVPISWMCKKQTSVSHSSTESEIISLDTGLRLDGLPALELWDLIVSVLGNVPRVSDSTGKPVTDVDKREKSQSRIDVIRDIDLVPSNVQSAHHEALLYVFEDNEAVIKMIIKGRSPTMRHVSRTHRVALDWLFDRINLDPKIQIKYIDTKNQLADILTKGSFTRDEWNHLLTLFNISHFSSTACLAAMAKRAQQNSEEGRVTAKSRPMMNLTARTPSIMSSSASTNPGGTAYGHHEPEQRVLDDSAGKPAAKPRSSYAQEYGSSQSSQVWTRGNGEHDRSGKPESWNSLEKVDPLRGEHLLGRTAHSARNEETIHDRTGKPASENVQDKANFEELIMGSDTTEFVNKVKNQVRIRQKRMSSDVAEDCTEHSIIWGMFMATTLNAATFMGKSYSTMRNVLQNEKRITLKQMFEISAATINNDEEVYCLDKIEYQRNTWTKLSLINDPVVIGLQSTKVYVFSDSVLCLGKVLQHPECNQAWKDRVAGARAERDYSDFDDIKGEPAEFEWNIFPGFTTLQLCDKINDLLSSLGQTPEKFTGRILFMSMFNDISCEGKDNRQQCLRDADYVKTFAKRFGIGQWSFIGPGSEKKWYPSENNPQGEWDRIAEDMLLEFAKSGHPIFRATTPLSRGKLKSKGKGKVSIHFSAEPETIDTIYRIILSVNQLSVYGAVAAICEEFVGQPDNTGQPVVLEGQSIVLGEVEAEAPAQEEPQNSNVALQKYFQQVRQLSPEDKLGKFCKEAGFMSVVEVGQYFVTRNASEFLLKTVACREYTLPRDDPASEAKGWIQGNTRIGPILEVTTTFQHFKFGVEVRIPSVKEDNSQSWVRISFGTIRYVNHYVKHNTHNFASSYEEKAEPASSEVIAARSKAKAKPQPRESSATTTMSLSERVWIDIVPSRQDNESHKVSKRVINILRHNQSVDREPDGAVQFYKIKFLVKEHTLSTQHWSDSRWLACLAAGGGIKRRFQYCPDYLGSIIYLRALQGHSGNSIIDLEMQDHVLITPGIFTYIYHVGSNFNLKSIVSNGLIPGGQELNGRQSVYFLPVDPRDEDHRDPEVIDYSVPRRARYLQKSWKRHQDTVFWIDIDQGIIKEGLRFYQTKSNAIILQGVLPPSCIVKAERLKGGELLYTRQYLSPRPPPKIVLRNDLDWTKRDDDLDYTVEHQPVGKLVQQSLGETVHLDSSKPIQSPKTNRDSTGKPVAQDVVVGALQEEPSSSDSTGKPVAKEEQHVQTHDSSGKPESEEAQHIVQREENREHRETVDQFNLATNDANIDFSVSGIPEETVKRSETMSILNLIRRITRHPQKEAVQNDLDKKQSFNAFSDESKKAIKESGNIEISEIVNTEPKLQCKFCLNHCNPGIIYCVCGHLMVEDSGEHRKYMLSTLNSFTIGNFYIRKDRPRGYRYGKAPGCKEYHTAHQLAKKCRKKGYDSIYDRYMRDKLFRSNMIDHGRTEKVIIDMDNLANEDHSFRVSKNEIEYYRQNWWVHSNVARDDKTMPIRHEPGFKEALSTMQRLKRAEDKKKQDTTPQPSSSSSSWQWQSSWWESDYEHSPQKWDYR